jgi:polysaccharide export outer membrane protein
VGHPGEIQCIASTPIEVSSETAGTTMRWILRFKGTASVTKGLEHVTAKDGGLVVDLPLDAKPALTWNPEGLTFKWLVPGAVTGESIFASYSPPAYPLGPGDKLTINVYNVPDMNQTVTVDPDGYITFPVLDKVQVQGLTVNQLQHKMETLLAQFVKAPQVNIQLIEYGSRYVNVLGEVGSPGRIPLKGALRVLDAISQAGGFTTKSGDVEIQRRDASGKLKTMVVTQQELLGGNTEKSNIYVLDQDVINVESVKSIYVSGEVKSPGSFPYNSDMTLLRAITLAGGFTQWAKKGSVDILRQTGDTPKRIQVDASKIEKGKIDDVPLEPNDHVVVRERKFF